MKKWIITAIWLAMGFVAWGCATQPAPKPSGMQLYQCGWPAFSFSFPDGWAVKLEPVPGQVFRVEAPTRLPNATASVNANMPAPVKFFSRSVIPALSHYGSGFDIVADQAITLKDGTPAQETLLNWVHQSGMPLTTLFITVKKKSMWITVSVTDQKGPMADDLKAIAYSLRVDPREQPPVDLPADVEQFLGEVSEALVRHDLETVMSCYSDQYRHSGRNKGDARAFYESVINRITDHKFVLTNFEKEKNLADIAGYVEAMGSKYPIASNVLRQLDDGRWEFYGDQMK